MNIRRRSRMVFLALFILAPLAGSSCAGAVTGTVVQRVEISAPPARVFAWTADLRNAAKMPYVVSVSNVRGEGLGASYDWETNWKGIKNSGTATIIDYVPDRRIVVASTCGKTITVLFTSTATGTSVTAIVEYGTNVPAGVGLLQNAIIDGVKEMATGYLGAMKRETEQMN